MVSGEAATNGVALVSRIEPADVAHGIGGYVDEQKRGLGATFAGGGVYRLYVPNGENPESDKYRYKLGWLAALRNLLSVELTRYPQLAVAGDFNVAPDDRDVYDPAAWAGQVLCTPAERAALASITDPGVRERVRALRRAP